MPRILCILALLLAFCAAPAFAQQLVGDTITADQETTETQEVDDASEVITTTINSGATLTICRPGPGIGRDRPAGKAFYRGVS